MNLHGMFLHVMGDALASVGVLVSGLLMMLLPAEWHWKFYFDPIATIFVNMLIVRSTLPLGLSLRGVGAPITRIGGDDE